MTKCGWIFEWRKHGHTLTPRNSFKSISSQRVTMSVSIFKNKSKKKKKSIKISRVANSEYCMPGHHCGSLTTVYPLKGLHAPHICHKQITIRIEKELGGVEQHLQMLMVEVIKCRRRLCQWKNIKSSIFICVVNVKSNLSRFLTRTLDSRWSVRMHKVSRRRIGPVRLLPDAAGATQLMFLRAGKYCKMRA